MTPADLDFDALEKRLLAIKRDAAGAVSRPTWPVNIDIALALLVLARRTVEAESRAAELEASTVADIEAVTEAESEAVREGARADAISDRIATIAGEAFGPFPVQTMEEDLTEIERGIHEAGKAREEWRARAEKAERERDEIDRHNRELWSERQAAESAAHEVAEALIGAQAKETEFRSLAGECLDSARLASTTSDGHRDAHAAFQRWATIHAPDAIGDEQKREAIDRLLRARRLLDPAHVEVLQGMRARVIDQLDVERAMEQYDDAYKTQVAELEAEVAALTAVLGGAP